MCPVGSRRSRSPAVRVLPLLLLFFTSPLILAGRPAQPDASALVEAADQRLRGDTQRGTYRMEIITPRWTRTLEMRVWGRGTEYFLIRIDEPAEEAGTGFLKIENEVWSYLPSVEKTIKIPPSMMHQSWMGSDFTYDDLVKESSMVQDYTHHLVGRETLDSLDTWHVRLEPKEDAPVVWGQVDLWIEADEPIVRKEVFYDQSGTRSGTLVLDRVRRMDDRRIPTRWTRTEEGEEGERTVMFIEEVVFDEQIPERFFSLQNLKRIR